DVAVLLHRGDTARAVIRGEPGEAVVAVAVENGQRLVVAGETGEGHHEVVIRTGEREPAAVDDPVLAEVLTESHGDVGAPVRGNGDGVPGQLSGPRSVVELRVVGRGTGSDAVLDAEVVGDLGV